MDRGRYWHNGDAPVPEGDGSTKHFCTTLTKLDFYFLLNWMGYDRGDSFPFDFEPNGNPFGKEIYSIVKFIQTIFLESC